MCPFYEQIKATVDSGRTLMMLFYLVENTQQKTISLKTVAYEHVDTPVVNIDGHTFIRMEGSLPVFSKTD